MKDNDAGADEGDTLDLHAGKPLSPGIATAPSGETPPERAATALRGGLPVPAVALGTTVGAHYRVIELLGAGGMGQVFVAENMSIGLRVAVKVLKPELMSDPVFQTRFQREARAVAAIQHTNVVRFLDLVLGDPTFLVMELVHGETLRERLKRDVRFPLVRALSVAERLARALSAVHGAGLVHRDLKPANIMLTPDAEYELAPKIIDFGVVRFATATAGLQVTRTGQVVGTLHYMAPEQISTGEVDARADLYALGSVLYHMIAGRPPFGDSSDEAHLMHNILFTTPPPTVAESEPLPPDVAALLEALLAKKPNARPRDATTVAVELGRIRRQLETPTLSAAAHATSRRPSLAARVATPVLLACCLGALGFVASRRSTPSVSVAPASRTMLSIASTPQGARVEVDGRLLEETTPTAVRGLAAGKHQVRIALGNRTPVEQTVVLGDGERQAIAAVVAPASHFVEIQTKPADATVYVDGRLIIQRTPVRVQFFDDEFYQLRLEKPGYEPIETRITPDQKDPAQLYKLEPEHEPRGSLIVDSNVTARVLVDGGDTGYSTPSRAILLPGGTHTVQIRTGTGGESSVQRISLTPGETVRVSLEPLADKKHR